MTKLRVLAADDSAVARRCLARALGADPRVGAVQTAANGRIALAKLAAFDPDVIVLDLRMPELDGLGTLAELRARRPDLPVVVFSVLARADGPEAFEALRLGAAECVEKPSGFDRGHDTDSRLRASLVPLLVELATKRRPRVGRIPATGGPVPPRQGGPAAPVPLRPPPTRSAVVAIGVSTGGPKALADLLPRLPEQLDAPVLIAQHLPAPFTGFLAERLDRAAALPVAEARDGTVLVPGTVWVAPGGHHLTVVRQGPSVRLAVDARPPVNGCRPSVDLLFTSVAAAYGPAALGVVLTGMGRDGLLGSEQIRLAGGRVVAQDEDTSVVWGMPGAVARAGFADAVVPVDEMAGAITAAVRGPRPVPVP